MTLPRRSIGLFAAGVNLVRGFKRVVGTGVSVTSNTTCVITTTGAIAIGDLVVVRWAADNLTAATPTGTVADSGGNAYTTHCYRGQNASAAGGVVGGIHAALATVAVAAGGTITLTLSGAVAHKSMYAESFFGYTNTLRNAAVVNSGSSVSATVTSGSATANDLVVGAITVESRAVPTAVDTDTTGGSWSANTNTPSATSGTDTSCVQVNAQYKIATVTGAQTFNQTVTNTDWTAMVAVFQAAP